jgi:hypothetical protein
MERMALQIAQVPEVADCSSTRYRFRCAFDQESRIRFLTDQSAMQA